MGILIQILIQIGCVYMEANWIRIHLSHVDCDPDLNPDSGPAYGARVNAAYDRDTRLSSVVVSYSAMCKDIIM